MPENAYTVGLCRFLQDILRSSLPKLRRVQSNKSARPESFPTLSEYDNRSFYRSVAKWFAHSDILLNSLLSWSLSAPYRGVFAFASQNQNKAKNSQMPTKWGLSIKSQPKMCPKWGLSIIIAPFCAGGSLN